MNAPDASLTAGPTPADLTLEDVRAAAARIEGAVVKTPMMHSITLSEIT
ncbi:MAG: threonine ammonia-lyase, partial [Pseudomonadota bacterium]